MKKINVGVIGVGYLGQFHAEKYAALPDANLVGIVDTDTSRGKQIAEKLKTEWYPEPANLLGRVDAVSIVVPTQFHYSVALPFLEQGIHVLLEKPMTVTLAQADELIIIAARKNVILQIGHIERFNPAVTAVKTRLNAPGYIMAERAAPFTKRCTDVNVILDLMIHDLDIVTYLANAEPREVSAAGASIITKDIDMAAARIVFQNGCTADVAASRISDEKKRVLRVFDGEKVYTSDYQSQKTSVAQKCNGSIPEITITELPGDRCDTLNEEIKAFVRSIQISGKPLVSGSEGRRALALAHLITDAITNKNTGFIPVQ